MYAEYRGKLIAGKPPKLKQKQELQRKKNCTYWKGLL